MNLAKKKVKVAVHHKIEQLTTIFLNTHPKKAINKCIDVSIFSFQPSYQVFTLWYLLASNFLGCTNWASVYQIYFVEKEMPQRNSQNFAEKWQFFVCALRTGLTDLVEAIVGCLDGKFLVEDFNKLFDWKFGAAVRNNFLQVQTRFGLPLANLLQVQLKGVGAKITVQRLPSVSEIFVKLHLLSWRRGCFLSDEFLVLFGLYWAIFLRFLWRRLLLLI